MALWVVRAGSHGEQEVYALENDVAVIGWSSVGDLNQFSSREDLYKKVEETSPEKGVGTIRMWTGELWAFREKIKVGDIVALPLKARSAIAFGKVTGPYRYDAKAPEGTRHQRPVSWVRTDLPRSEIEQDVLYSFGSTLTVFQVRRNEAEQRILSLLSGRAPAKKAMRSAEDDVTITEEGAEVDLDQFASDQIISHISRKFKGHGLARVVAGVLSAQGYNVLVSPPGADGGVDIIAGTGPMGFDRPRLAVQVKSSDSPADVSVVRELQGVMPRFGAEQGLVVCWGGFKESVVKETRQLFFTIRLWDAGDLVGAIQKHYQHLPADLQTEIPLKQIWTLVHEEE